MPVNLKAVNATTYVGGPLLEEYRRAKRAYHQAGDACKDTPAGSPERAAYAAARLAYQQAGKALRDSRGIS